MELLTSKRLVNFLGVRLSPLLSRHLTGEGVMPNASVCGGTIRLVAALWTIRLIARLILASNPVALRVGLFVPSVAMQSMSSK